MENFDYYANTRVLFGRGQIRSLPEIIEGYGKRVLLCCGGSSIKSIGLYETVRALLADHMIYEVSGIEPNPKIESVRRGVELCRENEIDVVLAVGGGSVIDCAKTIAAAAFYKGDAWDMIVRAEQTEKALPLVTVLTLSATGSEYDAGAVISNSAAKEKRGYDSELIRPAVSILDPTYTFSVPAYQTAAGSIDIMSHVLEQYFSPKTVFIADQLCEAVMRTVIKYAPEAIKKPDDYEARGQLMWASSIADNGLLCLGNQVGAFSCHAIEHELSAYYDITHGTGLAIVTPRWMRRILSDRTAERFAHYGTAVWGIDPSIDKYEIADKAITATEDFFKSLGVPMSLSELDINDEYFEKMSWHAVETGALGYAYVPLDAKDVESILRDCL